MTTYSVLFLRLCLQAGDYEAELKSGENSAVKESACFTTSEIVIATHRQKTFYFLIFFLTHQELQQVILAFLFYDM